MKKPFVFSALAIILVLVVLNNAYYYLSMQRNGRLPLTVWQFTNSFVTICTLACVILFIHYYLSWRDRNIKKLQIKYIEEVNQMMTKIRGERHDLLNHLNTVFALVSLRQYDELAAYMKDLVEETAITTDLILIGHPAVAAFLQCKIISAQQKGIPFTYSCENLEQFPIGIRSLDIIRLVGNLLDNAFDAVESLPIDQRRVDFRIWVDAGKLRITITNQGYIKQEEASYIFEPGFSTKGNHSGLGLAVVKQLVNKYKGSIHLDTMQPGIIRFDIQIGVASIA